MTWLESWCICGLLLCWNLKSSKNLKWPQSVAEESQKSGGLNSFIPAEHADAGSSWTGAGMNGNGINPPTGTKSADSNGIFPLLQVLPRNVERLDRAATARHGGHQVVTADRRHRRRRWWRRLPQIDLLSAAQGLAPVECLGFLWSQGSTN